jgi:class 3 adenylate cyclase
VLCLFGFVLQALVLHNQVVRQAAYDHVGSVLLQEGDSFLLAFHEPQDAVEFALQVSTSGSDPMSHQKVSC